MADSPPERTFVNREWWKRTGSTGELYVEVMADLAVFQIEGSDPAPSPVRLEYHAGTPDSAVGMTQRYSSLAKARAILGRRGYRRVDML